MGLGTHMGNEGAEEPHRSLCLYELSVVHLGHNEDARWRRPCSGVRLSLNTRARPVYGSQDSHQTEMVDLGTGAGLSLGLLGPPLINFGPEEEAQVHQWSCQQHPFATLASLTLPPCSPRLP